MLAGRGEERVSRLRAADARLAALARRDAFAAGSASALGLLAAGLTVVALMAVAIPAVHSGALAGVLLASIAFLALAAFEGLAPLPLAARPARLCRGGTASRRAVRARARGPGPAGSAGAPRARRPRARSSQRPLRPGRAVGARGREPAYRPGRRVALLGPSGAGKTTLAHLPPRFCDAGRGTVSLGGVDVRELAQDDLRRAVTFAAQDAHLFNTTLRENILLARRAASDEEVWKSPSLSGSHSRPRAVLTAQGNRIRTWAAVRRRTQLRWSLMAIVSN